MLEVPRIAGYDYDKVARSPLYADDIEVMHSAWTKAVMLTLALWSRPYAKADLW